MIDKLEVIANEVRRIARPLIKSISLYILLLIDSGHNAEHFSPSIEHSYYHTKMYRVIYFDAYNLANLIAVPANTVRYDLIVRSSNLRPRSWGRRWQVLQCVGPRKRIALEKGYSAQLFC
jgi:hypothetical protein